MSGVSLEINSIIVSSLLNVLIDTKIMWALNIKLFSKLLSPLLIITFFGNKLIPSDFKKSLEGESKFNNRC